MPNASGVLWVKGTSPEPSAGGAEPELKLLREACAEVYLHGNYRWLTQQMRTVVKEAFADAIEGHFANDPTSELKVDRWWREHAERGQEGKR